MKYYIDNNWQTSNYFWAAVDSLASISQRMRLLDGNKVILGGRTFQIIDDKKELEEKESEQSLNEE